MEALELLGAVYGGGAEEGGVEEEEAAEAGARGARLREANGAASGPALPEAGPASVAPGAGVGCGELGGAPPEPEATEGFGPSERGGAVKRRRGKRRARESPRLETVGKASKAVRAQFDRWTTAQEDLARDTDLDDWRAEQLRSGRAVGNANFEPVAEDWRRRLQPAAPTGGEAGTISAAAPPLPPSPPRSVPDLVALSEGLPQQWHALWDSARLKVYYANIDTLERTFARPQ